MVWADFREASMKTVLTLGLLLLSSMAMADPLELERELNGLNLDVQVSELDTDTQAGIESGLVQVLVTNHERFKVACQLNPGDTEAAPGLDKSPVSIIAPDGRRALIMSGEYGDSTLNALLTCIRDE
jgi:hypothetical protein